MLADPPRGYLERYIHSEICWARPDVMAVVHNHSPAVLPFTIARGARLRAACHMCGFLGADGPPLFEIRDHAGEASDLLIRNRALGAALAAKLGQARVVLMRGHVCTVAPGEADATRVTNEGRPRGRGTCGSSRRVRRAGCSRTRRHRRAAEAPRRSAAALAPRPASATRA